MILKLDLTGQQYQALLGALQHDVNFYQKPYLRGGGSDRTAYATIVEARTGEKTAHRGLPSHNVVLEVDEHQRVPRDGYADGDGEKAPRAVIDNIFDAIKLYPCSR